MGTLAQSDLWEFNKAYRIEQTAAATTDIAQSNRAIVRQLDANLQMQKFSMQVAAHTASLVEQGNEILLNIGEELRSLGFEMRNVQGAVQNVENAVREQTNLHKKHYDAVQKEQTLKEVIYNMRKYQTSMADSGDALAKAYGSKKLNDIIQQYSFSTRDLSSIQDKEYFDALKKECDQLWNSLTDKEKEAVLDIEKLHFVTTELINADIDEIAQTHLPFKFDGNGPPEPVLRTPPVPDIVKKHPQAFSDPSVSGLVEKKSQVVRRMGITALSAVAGFVLMIVSVGTLTEPVTRDGKRIISFPKGVPLVATTDQRSYTVLSVKANEEVAVLEDIDLPNGEKWLKVGEILAGDSLVIGKTGYVTESIGHTVKKQTSGLGMFFAIVLFLGWLIVAPLVFIVFAVSSSSLDNAVKKKTGGLSADIWRGLRRQYETALQENERLAEEYKRKHEEELAEFRARMEHNNAELQAHNTGIQKKRDELKIKHEEMIKEFRRSVNSWLNQHAAVQQFLPTL